LGEEGFGGTEHKPAPRARPPHPPPCPPRKPTENPKEEILSRSPGRPIRPERPRATQTPARRPVCPAPRKTISAETPPGVSSRKNGFTPAGSGPQNIEAPPFVAPPPPKRRPIDDEAPGHPPRRKNSAPRGRPVFFSARALEKRSRLGRIRPATLPPPNEIPTRLPPTHPSNKTASRRTRPPIPHGPFRFPPHRASPRAPLPPLNRKPSRSKVWASPARNGPPPKSPRRHVFPQGRPAPETEISSPKLPLPPPSPPSTRLSNGLSDPTKIPRVPRPPHGAPLAPPPWFKSGHPPTVPPLLPPYPVPLGAEKSDGPPLGPPHFDRIRANGIATKPSQATLLPGPPGSP